MKKVILLLVFVIAGLLVVSVGRADAPSSPTLPPIYFADGQLVAKVHIVIGEITVPAGSGEIPPKAEEFPVALSNAATFTSAESYKCFLSQPSGLGAGGIVRNTDGAHFVYRGARIGPAWQQNFFCIGN
jgi:hypothetical protein